MEPMPNFWRRAAFTPNFGGARAAGSWGNNRSQRQKISICPFRLLFAFYRNMQEHLQRDQSTLDSAREPKIIAKKHSTQDQIAMTIFKTEALDGIPSNFNGIPYKVFLSELSMKRNV